MFSSSFKPNYPYKKGDYSLRCPIDSDWKDKPQRVLLVIETIDSEDLSNSRLLYDRSKTVVTNLLNYSIAQARDEGFKRSKCAFAAVNFNNAKYMDQHRDAWPAYKARFAKRIMSIIEELDPTHVIVFGDWASQTLLPNIEHLPMKRGWVFPIAVGKTKCMVVPTLDLLSVYMPGKKDDNDEDDDDDDNKDKYAKSNLLFYVSRQVVNGLIGRMRYDLSHVKVKVRYIDTMEKFKALWAKVIVAEAIALDTETKNLSVNLNSINTMQLAIDNSGIGYFIPIDHPDTPFNEEERAYIKRRMRAFFYAETGKYPLKYIITLNGMFDTRILRVQLGIPLIQHKVWEITAGEWCFHPDTLVLTENGKERIVDIVNSKDRPRVWSYNKKDKKTELKSVLGASEHVSVKRLVEIDYTGGTVRVTEDHKIWSVTRQCYIEAAELRSGEELLLGPILHDAS